MNSNIKIGIVGCGWIAENAHLPTIKLNDNAEVFAVYDLQMERCLKLAASFNIPHVFDDYDEFLQSEVDAVIIATPNFTHADYSIRALEAGKHVLCEKPIALSTEEMSKIIAAAKKSGKIYMPGFVNRFRPDIKEMYELIKSGKIGEVQSVEAGWIRRSGVPRPGTWFTSKERSGGGVLIDLGSHVMDIALMLMGEADSKSVEVYKWNEKFSEKAAKWFGKCEDIELQQDVEESIVGKIQFATEKELLIALSWNAPIKNDCTYFFVKGTKGVIELRNLFGFSNNKLWDKDTFTIKVSGEETIEMQNETSYAAKAFANMLDYFMKKIKKEDLDNYLSATDGYNSVEMIEKMYNSKSINPNLRSYIEHWREED